MFKVALAIASVCLLAGCSPAPNAASSNVDIAKVAGVKSSFGSEFNVTSIGERAIDPKLLSARKLPEGLTFDPAACAKAAGGPDMPRRTCRATSPRCPRRATVSATSSSRWRPPDLPIQDPGKDCARVAFSGPQLRGAIEVIEAPHVDGTHTQGLHRVLQAVYDGGAHTGELYDYSAQFGDYQVIVIANPLVVPGQPIAKVDTQRARDLLVKGVSAVRS